MSAKFHIIYLFLLVPNLVQAFDLKECNHALGMESRRIEDSQITVSSSFDAESTGPANARIRTENGSGAWCPASQISANSQEWIQVELRQESFISAIETQGRWGKGDGLEYPTAYMLEYWRESLGSWARYKDSHGNEIIKGNSNTQSAILRLLDGGILVKLIRLIPVSEITRTVCLRFELYGCTYKESLLSYSLDPDGSLVDDLDLRDTNYDGISSTLKSQTNVLSGGIGRLFDGVIAADNFEARPEGWIGWHRQQLLKNYVTLDFTFKTRQNLSAILFYTSNWRKNHAQLFQHATVFVSLNLEATTKFSPRKIEFEQIEDRQFESARWVRIPIPNRIAQKLRVELYLTDESDWLLISEVKFESGNVPFQFAEIDKNIENLDNVMGSEDSLTYFAVEDSPTQNLSNGYRFLVALFLLSSAACMIIASLALLRWLKRGKKSTTMSLSSRSSLTQPQLSPYPKSVLQMILNTSEKQQKSKSKIVSMNSFQMQVDNLQNELLETVGPIKMPPLPNISTKPKVAFPESSNEYADPDSAENMNEPLLLKNVDFNASCIYYPENKAQHLYDPTTTNHHYIPCSANSTMGHSFALDSARYRSTPHPPPSTSNSWVSGTLTSNLPPTPILEIDPRSLRFIRALGTGRFGQVNLCQMDGHRPVAVKHLRENAPSHLASEFRLEIGMLNRLRHQNILRVIGVSKAITPLINGLGSLKNEVCCVVEFMPNGDLREFLRRDRPEPISNETLLSFCTQIAAGMAYLESCNFVHRDLAARNCLMDADGTIKISDFGMARNLNERDYYQLNGEFALPIRWMAWESVLLGRFTLKTDVWAFGVTIWEIFSECRIQPYAELTDVDVIENLKFISETRSMKYTLPKPQRCFKQIYEELIKPCWHYDHSQRPSFRDLHRQFQNFSIAQSHRNS